MAVLRDLSYARPRSTYVPLNVAGIDAVGAALQEDYEKNKSRSDLILGQLNNMKVRDVNTPILEETRNKALEQLNTLAEKQDYENSAIELNNLANELNNNPLLQGALLDYKQYQEYLKKLDELKDVPADRRQLATTYSNATNNKRLEYDPVTGYKNMFTGYTPITPPDFEKTVGTFADKIKSSTVPLEIGKDEKGNPVYMGKTGNGYYIVGEKEEIPENEALGIISGYVANNPEFQGYVKENLMFDKFNRKFNPETGQFDQFSLEDFGGAEELTKKMVEAGLDPAQLEDPAVLEKIYDKAFLEQEIGRISKPYAEAVSFKDVEFQYKDDPDYALQLALKKMAAEEASQKRILNHKDALDQAKEQREQAKLVLSNPVEAEPVNLELAEKSLETIDSELKLLTAKKEASMKGATNEQGAPVTFSPEEAARLVQLTNDKKVLEHEKSAYMKYSTISEEGNRLIKAHYDKFVEKSGNPENISYQEFKRRIADNDIKEPKQNPVTFLGFETSRKNPDLNDVNGWLKSAKEALGRSEIVQKEVNNIYTNEASGYFAFDEGSKSGKSSLVNQVKSTLAMNIINQNGIGYDVVGSGQGLNSILGNHLTREGEETKYKGRAVDIEAIPLNNEQAGVTDQDLMYQFIIREKGSDKNIMSVRVRPQDQEAHSNMLYEMNKELASIYSPDTKIGRDSRRAIINYELPQFKISETRKLLDAQVNDTTPKGVIGVGHVVNVGDSYWTVIKSVDNIPDHFTDDNPNMPVTLQQQGYHLVRLKPNTPADIVLNQDNLSKYLYNSSGSIFDNALINDRNISNDKLKKYAQKNKNAATHFSSIEDAVAKLHTIINTPK